MELRLPDNPTEEDLVVIEKYLYAAKRKLKRGKNSYQNKKTLTKGLIIFQPLQRVSGDNYCMRYYVGDRKYKVLSLGTNDESKARDLALEKWSKLRQHIEGGGSVFEKTIEENFDEYLDADDEERNKKFNDLVLKEAAKILIDQIEFNADQSTNLLTVNSN